MLVYLFFAPPSTCVHHHSSCRGERFAPIILLASLLRNAQRIADTTEPTPGCTSQLHISNLKEVDRKDRIILVRRREMDVEVSIFRRDPYYMSYTSQRDQYEGLRLGVQEEKQGVIDFDDVASWNRCSLLEAIDRWMDFGRQNKRFEGTGRPATLVTRFSYLQSIVRLS